MFSPRPERFTALDDLITGVGTVLGHAAAGAAKVVRETESPSSLARLGAASATVCVAVIASKLGGGSDDARPTLRGSTPHFRSRHGTE